MHPVLFFLLIYGIALFLALFICRTVYYSIHGETTSVEAPAEAPQDVAAVAYH
jgi:hypothetical protein